MKDAKEQLREYILKAKLYRAIALIFAVCGFAVFVFLMSEFADGRIYQALKDPFLIVILLVPFLPAAVLSWMSARSERKAIALIGDDGKPT